MLNFNINLKMLDGTDMYETNGDEKKILTLKKIAINALLSNFNDEHELNGEEKLRRYLLSKKIYESDKEIGILSEDVVLIKILISKLYSTLIAGQAIFLINLQERENMNGN